MEAILWFFNIKKWNNKYIISFDKYFKIIFYLKLISLTLIFSVVFTFSYFLDNYLIFIFFSVFYLMTISIISLIQKIKGNKTYKNVDLLFYIFHLLNKKIMCFFEKNTITNIEESKTIEGIISIVTPNYNIGYKEYYLNNKLHCLKHGAITINNFKTFFYNVEIFYINGIKIKEENFKKEVDIYIMKNKIKCFLH
jgi:hypothetical protein